MTKEEIKGQTKDKWIQNKRHREEIWLNLKPFKIINDVPELPVVTKEEWDGFYVPILIKCGAIPKKDLIVGQKYLGACRNSDYGIWNGTEFTYKRIKFGTTFQEKINHFEDDNGYDLFVPLKIVKND